jgi:hypothetical protein
MTTEVAAGFLTWTFASSEEIAKFESEEFAYESAYSYPGDQPCSCGVQGTAGCASCTANRGAFIFAAYALLVATRRGLKYSNEIGQYVAGVRQFPLLSEKLR